MVNGFVSRQARRLVGRLASGQMDRSPFEVDHDRMSCETDR